GIFSNFSSKASIYCIKKLKKCYVIPFCNRNCFRYFATLLFDMAHLLWPNLWQNRSAQVLKTIFKPNSLKIMLGAKLNLRLNFTMICIKMNFIIMQLHYF